MVSATKNSYNRMVFDDNLGDIYLEGNKPERAASKIMCEGNLGSVKGKDNLLGEAVDGGSTLG